MSSLAPDPAGSAGSAAQAAARQRGSSAASLP